MCARANLQSTQRKEWVKSLCAFASVFTDHRYQNRAGCMLHPTHLMAFNYGFGIPSEAGSTLAAFSSHSVQAKLDWSASKTFLDSAPVLPDSR